MVPSPNGEILSESKVSATVLVAEISGFSDLADQAEDPAVRQLLKETWERINRVVKEFDGSIVSYIGEELVVFWPPDVPGGDIGCRAVNCALSLRSIPAGMAAEGRPGALGRLKFKIGLSAGELLVMRAELAGQARIQGDPVNAARELAVLASPDRILIGQAVFQRVHGVFRLQRVRHLLSTGEKAPLTAYSVVARLDQPARIRYVGNGGLETRMVGREAQFHELVNLLEPLDVTADPFLALVIGEAGFGKSRMLYEFFGEVETGPRSYHLLSVRNFSEMQRTPFFMWKTLLKTRFGIREDMDEAESQDALLKGILKTWGKRLGRYTAIEAAHFIGALIGVSWRNSPYLKPFDDDPAGRNQHAFQLVREFFHRLSDSAPIILLVDDLQWADPGSLELLRNLLNQGTDAVPMLVLASVSPDFLADAAQWQRLAYRQVVLEAIPYTFEMIGDAFPSQPRLPDALLARMIGKAGGNPLYLEEIVRHIYQSNLDEQQGQRKPSAAYPIPDTLAGLLAMRLEQVSSQAREVLQLASVTGRTFWRGSVIAAARQPVGTGLLNLPAGVLERVVDEALDEIVQAELAFRRTDPVFGGEQEFIFKHPLVREVAYAVLPERYRKFYHFAAAKWLAEKNGSEMQVPIAEHFEKAGNISSALRYYQYAKTNATACGIPAEAELLESHIRTIRRSEQTAGPLDPA